MRKRLIPLVAVVAIISLLTACKMNITYVPDKPTEGVPTTYTATATLYANHYNASEDTSISSSDIVASAKLINAIEEILRSDATMEAVTRKSGCSLSNVQLSEMVTIKPVDETQVFMVSVTAEDQQLAETIVNTIANILPERVASILDNVSVKVISTAKAVENTSVP